MLKGRARELGRVGGHEQVLRVLPVLTCSWLSRDCSLRASMTSISLRTRLLMKSNVSRPETGRHSGQLWLRQLEMLRPAPRSQCGEGKCAQSSPQILPDDNP